MSAAPPHIPVLLAEVRQGLGPINDALVIDGTFGAGGYTRAFLDDGARVVAIDRDRTAILAGRPLVEAHDGRLALVEERFSRLDHVLGHLGIDKADAVVLDIGVSSMQLDRAERGFSFRSDGPLDMRMGQAGETAADLIARLGEKDLADLIFTLGEERLSRQVARAIVKAREEEPITTTRRLADIVGRVVRGKPGDIHPATRTFQALRIAVNDELGELERALTAAEKVLRPGGRLAVVTFHSLEDRIVKRFLTERSGRAPAASRHQPSLAVRPPSFDLAHKKPIEAGDAESAANPRARSAKLRVAIRTAAPAWGGAP